MTTTIDMGTAPDVKQQAGLLLGHVAGYVAHRSVAIGLRSGLIAALAAREAEPEPLTARAMADTCGLDAYYVAAWCRAALGAQVLERDGDGYRLAPHMATLLLDEAAATYVGGVFTVMLQPEMFDRFEASLASGERLWWDGCSPEFIAAVSRTGRPFYTRLIPGGLEQVPGLGERLRAGCRVADTACGAGAGLERLAANYPACELVGVDGDAHSLDLARTRLAESGVEVELVHSTLEDFTLRTPVDVVINNISMHECRDIDRVTERVLAALEPGGWFVISDFPFPDTDDGLRSTPGRVMSGIQLFEAQIDDQLLPRAAYDDLLDRHGFVERGWAQLTPMHAVTWGRAPRG